MKGKLYIRIDPDTQEMSVCLEDGTPIAGEYMVRVTDEVGKKPVALIKCVVEYYSPATEDASL